jgi:predicted dehydrogenase
MSHPANHPPTVSTSRRRFLKQAVAASTAFAVPNIMTRPLFGAPSANETIHAALIGCGGIGRYHRGNLARIEGVRITAVADAFRSKREKFAAELNAEYKEASLVKAHEDFREILARPDIDAVFIGAHDNWHTPMAIAAMKAGKDVYCQKPLALDFSLTKRLRQTAQESKRVFQFGTQFRSSAKYRQMVRLVRNGYIGELKKCSCGVAVWRGMPESTMSNLMVALR